MPPPPHRLLDCLGELEGFLHDSRIPPILKAALAHVQFETIHPFLDGNGRLGRLLITLLLCSEGVLSEPLLYLSLYFKRHRDEYYRLLQSVRTEGDWKGWIHFYLEAVRETGQQGFDTARDISRLFGADRESLSQFGARSATIFRIHDELKKEPIVRANTLTTKLGASMPTINKAIRDLGEAGVLHEITGRRRDRIYVYHRYLALLNEEIG